jgi:glutamate-ammonia-ligase adenylyltransferase
MSPEVLGTALGEAPDPELARVAVSRIGERPAGRELLARPDIIPAATRLLGFSTAAADFFVSHPEELEALADLQPRSAAELHEEAETDVARFGPETGLRRFRRRAAYRLAARDLAGAPVQDVMSELTGIGEACLRVALAGSGGGEIGLAVIAMGKLGGSELNYASDVDVLFLHRNAGGPAQEAAARSAGRVMATLSEATGEGIALRVDANLRPEGRSGPLSRSLESMLEYYGRHAATWERQALLKARPVAGDLEAAGEFVRGVAPFVYPAVLPASAIEEVRASKARIEEHVRAQGKERSELKRGRGGIRDVEFAVQLLQLVHGRRDEGLREPNTLRALARLAEGGYVAQADADALADSYRFLRTLEHRLQMVRDTQTHELPADHRALGPLARSVGLSTAGRLMAEYDRHTGIVRDLHERLFYRPLMEAFGTWRVPGPSLDPAATDELLSALGFADPVAARNAFVGLVDPETRLGKVLGTLFPVIAPAIAFSSLPDAALIRFGRVVSILQADERLPDRLADRPDAARRMASLVAQSSAFADLLAASPNAVDALMELPAREHPLFPGDPHAGLVRVAGAYAAGELRVPDVGRRLAVVADSLLADAVATTGPELPFAVIGMGKLGGEELSFASDLDLLFVYEGEGANDFGTASRAAEAILARGRAAGWQVDPDLRPEGRAGPLVRSIASYMEYWQRWAQTWEYQALLRARFVAGDEQLGRRFLSNAADFAYPDTLTIEQVVAIRRMRVRMEEERVRPPEARRFHFKLGYGGLADVQWAVELSLMRHGFTHPGIRRANTLEALEALAAARLIEDSVGRALGEAYVFLTEIKNAMEIERRVQAEALPPTPEGQAALARRLGYEEQGRQRFLQDYRRVTRAARLAMERVFYGDE